jgi:hypothetical protein
MEIDATIARELGFPRAHDRAVERERRWLCREVPRDRVRQTFTISDLYVRKLTRKGDVDVRMRLITSIYLPEDEFAVMAKANRRERAQLL